MRLALDDEVLIPERSFFDYGCGRGDDIRRLRSQGIQGTGWDPNFRPEAAKYPADVVNLGYVVNVIEDARERREVLKAAWELTRRVLVVSARLRGEQDLTSLTPFEDGWITGHKTFQKFYEQDELRTYVDATLGASSVAAGPGVFYVFRDEADKQSLLAARARRRPIAVPRRRVSDELFEQHQDLLAPLMEFFAMRGRLPTTPELDLSEVVEAFGSVKKAWRVVLWATNERDWAGIRQARAQDLLLYVALAAFSGRPRFGKLPADLQRDIKGLFSTYQSICAEADNLLHSIADADAINTSCEGARVGKLTQSALYVHREALSELPLLLRVFEGAACSLIGSVEEGDIIKIRRYEPKVSYLSYPDFWSDPHPALTQSISVELPTFRVKYRHYHASHNPPILHRKDLFIAPNSRYFSKFRRLTESEERAGLLAVEQPIGRRNEWLSTLDAFEYELKGHRLLKRTR